MTDIGQRAIAIVGVGAVLPDAPDAPSFWANLIAGRDSIAETPPDRWDPALYYDPDPKAPDKSYSKIGGWVREWNWEPLKWKLPIPPAVSAQMDRGQQWAIAAAREALTDFGWPKRPLEPLRTAVIVGNAMAGERHYMTALRVHFPEWARELEQAPHFGALPEDVRRAILGEVKASFGARMPEITEDTMPGELANIIAGRVANLFDFHGPNFVVDAACASAMAAFDAAIEGLVEGEYDAVLTGGVDANMSASTFVKFCKIGALSATGSRPYADGADGFVMGEGAALFVLRRLADAERDGDKIYAVIRGIGGASDGRGKGITAPNPAGQRLAIERAWKTAGLDPACATLVEGHGTSTKVGDVIEAESLAAVFGASGVAPGSIPIGSVKSNIGHLKAAAGAAGILKTALALHHKRIPPTLHCGSPNPAIDFAHGPFLPNTELREWVYVRGGARCAGVSAFGFGGTNFHTVLEEYVPGRLCATTTQVASAGIPTNGNGHPAAARAPRVPSAALKAPLRGALVMGAASEAEIAARLAPIVQAAEQGVAPPPTPPREEDLRAPVRVAIDYADAPELAAKGAKALKAIAAATPAAWKALRAQGIFRGEGTPGRVAFLFTGQGSQYVNMLAALRATEPLVKAIFDEADRVMTPILGRPLTSYIFVDPTDPAAVERLEEDLKQTEITQPAVLACDAALAELLGAYGIVPDQVIGHSLGEYGALVAAGVLSFDDALTAVSARGHAMHDVSMGDNGLMAAVFAPVADVERVLAGIDDYVVPANINARKQVVIGGSTSGVTQAIAALEAAGMQVAPLKVSHAFHTSIVAPASEALCHVLEQLDFHPPVLPIISNVTGEFYPMGPGIEREIVDLLTRQVSAPVQFVRGLEALYAEGARVFVEVGPKKALQGFVDDVLGPAGDVTSLFTNHPKTGDIAAFNQALCGLYAAGLGVGVPAAELATPAAVLSAARAAAPVARAAEPLAEPVAVRPASIGHDQYDELQLIFADAIQRARASLGQPAAERRAPAGERREPIAITGAALGLPGTARVFDDANVARLLRGEQLIDAVPMRLRQAMVDKHVTRLVKSETGEPHFEVIDRAADVIKLAGRAGGFDLVEDYGYPAERVESLDRTTRLAIAAGLDALRDAGLPLVMHHRTTTRGTTLPDRWMLPEALRDETGVVFASAFPGYDAFAGEVSRSTADRGLRERLADLRALRERFGTEPALVRELDRRIAELEATLAREAYTLDRTLLFRLLSMGHSQFAEYIGARGPNTQVNCACASTTLALGLAEDWIRQGRCRRVIVISADDATSDRMMEWIGAGFLASGAAATDDAVEDAALPFDRRRHGMVIGMGAAAMVVERADAARERGVRPIAEVLSTIAANSAYHGTRLDVTHIAGVMERLVADAERDWGVRREAIASQTVFMSHETYTPARGGSAQAEVEALRRVFGRQADEVVVANTKGFTGHAMGAGIEDVLAVKALETGLVPPVANYREPDPELGSLSLSKGGAYDVRYALRLAAGFGSQISLSLVRWVPSADGRRTAPDALGFEGRVRDRRTFDEWLERVTGEAAPTLETVHRTLRVREDARRAAPVPTPTPAPAAASAPKPAAIPVEAVAVPVAAVPTVATPHAPPPTPQPDPVLATVLAVVAAQTGYPADLLDPSLDLEADLGIDTVKQAEMFAAVRAQWGIERDAQLKLRDFPTIGHIVSFVRAKRPDLVIEPESSRSRAGVEPESSPASLRLD
ncbi:MAG TPA: beta-ketoacyl synthase N-terminal-like domain-containing protein, partial [Gemmatimonadaceae bacterium]|nr:beta-ketoacyl synthase N-terminal-like domain-containing protein [Gemmatimonadaceae bacterium]